MVDIENKNGIAILRMNDGSANVMNLDFNLKLLEMIRKTAASSARAIILTGHGKIFCAGVDLPRMLEGGTEYVRKFLSSFRELLETLYFCPKPVIMAVNGHAIAGGCILACASDRTLMATGKGQIGVPELHVGLPFPPVPMEILRSKIDPHYFEAVTRDGKNYSPHEALQRGIVDSIEEPAQLLDKALLLAESLVSIRPELFAINKRQTRQPVRDAMDQSIQKFEDTISTIWESEETFVDLRAFVARTLRSK